MTLLLLQDVRKAWGAHVVLDGADLQVDPGEKLGLVGPNGAGKSTLLALIEGQEEIDGGSLSLRRGARLGYVPQRPSFPPGATVRGHVEGGLGELLEAIAAHRRATEALERLHAGGTAPDAAGDDAAARALNERRLIAEQERAAHAVDALGGWHTTHRVEQVLAGIGLDPALWDRECATLSGGEQSRVALARALVGGHDLLLLDEPTNHLDLDSKEVLLDALADYGGTLVFVSHDRYFVDKLATKVIEVGGGEALLYPGGYEDFLYWKKQREARLDTGSPASKAQRAAAPVPALSREERDDGTASVATRIHSQAKPAAALTSARPPRARGKAKASPAPRHAGAPPLAASSAASALAPRIRQSGAPPERQVLEREVKRLKARLSELETRVTQAEQAVKALEARMAEPGFYDDRERASQAADEHQKRMWEAGDLMAQWEALQGELDDKTQQLAAVTPTGARGVRS